MRPGYWTRRKNARVEFLDTEERVVIEATPTKAITYDGDKMASATDKFLASRKQG